MAAHCKKLDYPFSPKELAYLIWQSNCHTLPQKLAAWEELIRTQPDEIIPELQDTLHHFLRNYMDRLQAFLTEFRSGKGIFSYEKLYADAPHRFWDESPLYDSYDACVSAIREEFAQRKNFLRVLIQKRPVYSAPTWEEDLSSVHLTPEAQPVGLGFIPFCKKWEILDVPYGFYQMSVHIPTPFCRGDLVTGIDAWGQRTDPCVVDTFPDEPQPDYWDLCPQLLTVTSAGHLFRLDDCHRLSLEFYRGELTGKDRILSSLQRFLADQLPVEELFHQFTLLGGDIR